ncbi:MAG: zinc-dependent metalloprotease [Bacteroides sp.]|nr:zinc-dependent metalloprotease [Bacteroides sp.]
MTIDRNIFHRDIFMTTRVADISGHKHIAAGQTFHPGKVFHFVEKEGQLLFEEKAYEMWCDSSQNVHAGLQNNQTPKYPFAFPIHRSDPASVTIDVTRFFGEAIPEMMPLASGLLSGKLAPALSGIRDFRNLPDRIHIRSELIYTGSSTSFSLQLHYNLLLMDDPAPLRQEDPRVGYFTRNYKRLQEGKSIERLRYITRWNLQPADQDKYLSGELTEVVRPIVFYIDPALPTHISHYAQKGILDWNRAFEAIGFKDVIQVRELPDEEHFDSHDISVNMLRYIPQARENAMGATLADPRSGEILQADIYWYHDLEERLRKWRFVQTAACDPAAREEKLSEETLGEMIRYVAAHEMGHVLGLKHNMRGSFAYPVDSLRSASFTAEYGTTASIMDYARFNYVAQPGDLEKGVSMLPPLLGPYDYMAIAWGYTPVPEGEDEQVFLRRMVDSRQHNPMYLFAAESRQEITSDPSAQADVLGDDVILSSKYGIRNLKVITANLHNWLFGWTRPKEAIGEMYEEILEQYFLYLYSSASYIGGTFYLESGARDTEGGYRFTDQVTGFQALDFILEELLHGSSWLIDDSLNKLLGNQQETLLNKQSAFLRSFLTTIPRRFALNSQGDVSLLFGKMTDHLFRSSSVTDLSAEALRITYLQQLNELSSLSTQRDATGLVVAAAAENELRKTKRWTNGRLTMYD